MSDDDINDDDDDDDVAMQIQPTERMGQPLKTRRLLHARLAFPAETGIDRLGLLISKKGITNFRATES